MSSWKFLNSVFPDVQRFSDMSPAVATHDNALYIVWQDKAKSALWWCRSRLDSTFPSPTAVNKGAEVSAMSSPGLIDLNNVLHLIFAESGLGGQLFHMQFDDVRKAWLQRAGVGLSSQYAPTLTVINGRILLVARVASEKDEDQLFWAFWDPVNGWSKAQPVRVATTGAVQTVDRRPALLQIGTDFYLIAVLNKSFAQLRFDINALTWTPIPTIKGEAPTTGCSGVGYPLYTYGFVAYGVGTAGTVSVSQYNLNTWMVRESLQQETIVSPALVILGSWVHCFWVNPQGLLVRAARLIDIGTDDWMKRLDDKTPIYSITIPGTHDSAATTEFMSFSQSLVPFVQTQRMSFPQQLSAGIRFFDLRLNLDTTGTLQMVHGPVGLGLPFSAVMTSFSQFLASNPSEALIVSIKDDGGGDAAHQVLFENAVGAVILVNPNLWYAGGALPTLRQCRGRLILLRRYPTTVAVLGFDVSGAQWPDNTANAVIPIAPMSTTVVVQDNYNYKGVVFYDNVVGQKWKSVSNQLAQTQTVSPDKRTLFLNYLSATGPPRHTALDIATGGFYVPEEAQSYSYVKGMNQQMWNYLNDNKDKDKKLKRLGVLIFDYPEVPAGDLLNAVINLNPLKK